MYLTDEEARNARKSRQKKEKERNRCRYKLDYAQRRARKDRQLALFELSRPVVKWFLNRARPRVPNVEFQKIFQRWCHRQYKNTVWLFEGLVRYFIVITIACVIIANRPEILPDFNY